MIVNKTATRIDEEIIFEAAPMLGVGSLISSSDIINGTTADRYFEKYFEYSLDGVHFSKRQILNNTNLSSIVFSNYSIFILRLIYIRKGTDSTGNLTFEEFDLTGTFTPIDQNKYFHYNSSLFSEYFDANSKEVLNWSVNVLQKLYYPGLIPKYIVREINDNEKGEDEDYLAFWFTVTHFLGIIVTYARLFQNFNEVPKLLKEYLKQKEILFCEDDISLEELNYLMNNFYKEIAKRGGEHLIDIKNGSSIQTNGEVRRNICWNENDEFLFSLTPRHQAGWNVNNASPLFKGIKSNKNTNKFETNSFENVLNANLVNSEWSLNANSEIISPLVVIDEKLNYTFQFLFSQDSLNSLFTVEVSVYDRDDNLLDCLSVIDGTQENHFLNSFNAIKNNVTYQIRAILYNFENPLLGNNGKLNIGFGQSLLLPEGANYIRIKVKNEGNGTVKLSNSFLKISSINYNTCFIQTNHLIQGIFRNNNQKKSFEEIIELTRDLLIPYNSWLKLSPLNNSETSPEEFYWLPGDPTCEVVPLIWEPYDPICETISWEGIDPYCVLGATISWEGINPYCILNNQGVISWEGTDPYCIIGESFNDIITWTGIDPYCVTGQYQPTITKWEGIDPFCEIVPFQVVTWKAIEAYCQQVDNSNTGYMYWNKRNRVIVDENGEIIDDTFVEPNLPGLGIGPYFPPILDVDSCPIPPPKVKNIRILNQFAPPTGWQPIKVKIEDATNPSIFIEVEVPVSNGGYLDVSFTGFSNVKVSLKLNLVSGSWKIRVNGSSYPNVWNLLPVDVGLFPVYVPLTNFDTSDQDIFYTLTFY